jgi:hypothetical protein
MRKSCFAEPSLAAEGGATPGAMHKIKDSLGKRVKCHVVSPHFHIWQPQGYQKTRINIGGENLSVSSDAIGESNRDGTTARSYSQAVPTGCETRLGQMMDADVVKQLG